MIRENKEGYKSGIDMPPKYSIHIYEKCHNKPIICTFNVLIICQKVHIRSERNLFDLIDGLDLKNS